MKRFQPESANKEQVQAQIRHSSAQNCPRPPRTQNQKIFNPIGLLPNVESGCSSQNINGKRDSDDEVDPIQRKRWTLEEEQFLLNLHNKLGNKWTIIADHFPEKDHNCIKNHFYAQLRKAMRRINNFIKAYFAHQFKPMNMNLVSKAITMLSEKGEKVQFPQWLEAKREQKVQEFKKIMFEIAKKEQFENLKSAEIKGLQQFLTEINQTIAEIKKINLTHKKKKSKRAKMPPPSPSPVLSIAEPVVAKVEEKPMRFASFATCDDLPSPQSDPRNSFIVVYYNQMHPFVPIFRMSQAEPADPAMSFCFGSFFVNS